MLKMKILNLYFLNWSLIIQLMYLPPIIKTTSINTIINVYLLQVYNVKQCVYS
jgi:hypothetical protein